MAQDKIIRFPGPAAQAQPPAPAAPAGDGTMEAIGIDQLNEDQRKAIQLVLAGYSFVLVAVKPTDRGADFYTALHGEPTDLRNAQPHLGGVIERLFARRGL